MTLRVWGEKFDVEQSHDAQRPSKAAMRPVGPWSLLATLERISSGMTAPEPGCEELPHVELRGNIDGAAQRLRACGKNELANALERAGSTLQRIAAVSAVRQAELAELRRISGELPSLLFGDSVRSSEVKGPSLARARVRPPEGADGPVDQPLCGRTVVIVNEDAEVAWLQNRILNNSGALVHLAYDGRDALEVCRRITPDAILADAFMSGLDGLAISRAIRRNSLLRDMGVLLVGARRGLLDRLAKLGAGADGYLVEKADAPTILNRVAHALEARTVLEAQLAAKGEVKGTLTRIAPRTLLTAVARLRTDGKVSIKHGSETYEAEIAGGSLLRITVVAEIGRGTTGREALRKCLALRDGEFDVG